MSSGYEPPGMYTRRVGLWKTQASSSVVVDRVGDAGLGQDRRDLRLPHALREPRSKRPRAERGREPIRERADLRDRVAARDADEDRFVVAAGKELDLPAALEIGDVAEDVGAVRLEPIEERAREVEGRAHARVPVERSDERRVGLLGHVFEDGREIPGRLVLMEYERELETLRHASEPHYTRGRRGVR